MFYLLCWIWVLFLVRRWIFSDFFPGILYEEVVEGRRWSLRKKLDVGGSVWYTMDMQSNGWNNIKNSKH